MSPFYCPPPLGQLLKPALGRKLTQKIVGKLAAKPLSIRFYSRTRAGKKANGRSPRNC